MSASVAEVLFSFELSAEVAVSDFVSAEVSVLAFVVVVSVLFDVAAVVSVVSAAVVVAEVVVEVSVSDELLSSPLQPQSSKQPSRAAAINLYLIFVPFRRKGGRELRRLKYIRI